MGIAVDLVGGLPRLIEREHLRDGRMDHALRDEPIRLMGLAVVRKVTADDPLEAHPEVPVVVFVHVAARGGAGGDGAALASDVDAGAKGLAPGMLEDDVGVIAAGELADSLAEALPFARVLGVLVLPELVPLGTAVDDELSAHRAAEIGLLGTRDDAHRDRTAIDGVLGRIGAEAAGGSPDEDNVALLHAGPVARDELAVCGRVDESGGGGFLPGEVRRLRHELVALHDGELGQTAEVRFKPPDALLGVEHRVVVSER